MFKRLTSVVVALGLTVSLASTALSGPETGAVRKEIPVRGVQSPKAKVPSAYQVVNQFRQNFDGVQSPSAPNPKPGPNSPDTSACYEQDYTDYANASFFYTWTSTGTQMRKLGMRMDVPTSYLATINSATAYIAKLNGAGATVPVEVTIWSDAGGVPGAILYQEVFNVPVDPGLTTAGGAYYTFPFTTPPQVYEVSYHVSVGRGAASVATDTVRFFSDDGGDGGTPIGTGRSSYYPNGGPWTPTPVFFADPAFDPNFIVYTDQCIAYSECFRDFGGLPGGNFVEGWIIPDNTFSGGSTLQGLAQRFVATGPETIKVVHVRPLSDPLFGLPAETFYNSSSTNGITVGIHADDGTGNVGTLLGSVTVPGGLANIYPLSGNAVPAFDRIQVDFSSLNLVVLGPYHVTVNMTSSNPADGQVIFGMNSTASSPGFVGGSANFIPPSPNWERTGTSAKWLAEGGGEEQAFYIQIDVCLDEFAQCQTQVLYGPSELTDAWFISSQQHAQKVTGLPVNRVDKVRFSILDETLFGGNPGDNGAPVVDLTIYSDGGAIPGALVYTQNVPTPVYYPGWNEVVIPGGYQVLGDFYVGYRNTADINTVGYIYGAANADAEVNGGAKFYSNGSMAWLDLGDVAGGPQNWLIEVDFCSIPVPERVCAPEANWATRNHDYQRTGASGTAIGDAYCDLNLTWFYEHPSSLVTFSGPIIYNGLVVCAFTTEYRIFDLTTGATLDVLSSADDATALGGNIRCTPSIQVVNDTNGVPQTYLFLGGGNSNAMSAWDIDVLPATLAWKVTPLASKGHGALGAHRYVTTQVLNVSGTEVLYWADDGNRVFAANADDGTPFVDFDGNSAGVSPYTPFALGGAPLVSGANDGVRIFYNTFINGGDGDIFALNAADGTVAWQLTTAGGLKGASLFPVSPLPAEGFQSGVSVDLASSAVYANSTMQVSLNSQFPADGVFYNLKTTDGTELAPSAISARTLTTHVQVDANRVIVPTIFTWGLSGGLIGGDLVAFNKLNNGVAWGATSFPAGSTDMRYTVEGVLTCEPNGVADYSINFNRAGYLGFFNADDGSEVFHRRIDYGAGANLGMSGAVGQDGSGNSWVTFAANFGAIYAFSKGSDRARLEILKPSAVSAVPFGSPADTIVVFEDMYFNSGCTDLIVSLTADDASNGTTPLSRGFANYGTVREGIAQYASTLTSAITADGFLNPKFGIELAPIVTEETGVLTGRPEVTRGATSRAALALPAFLNQNGGSYAGDVFDPANGNIVTAAQDTADIRVHVNGPLVSRGPNNFYVEFTLHNDPDYFLNDNSIRPEVFLTLVGGCLTDTTTLAFGNAGANSQLVWNSGRHSDGDAAAPGHGFDIDGADVEVFQGSYVYGVSQYRIAMNCPSWQGGATDADDWISMQGDPNFCNADCKPALTTNVVLGSASSDGQTYNSILGNVVCKSYIDSVINYFDGTQWNWGINPGDAALATFDNDSTIGLYVNTRTVGALNDTFTVTGGLLNQGTVEVMEFSNRNATNINGWRLWTMTDYDIGTDTADWNPSISTAFSAKATAPSTIAWGTTKLPFGCGYDNILNVKALDATQAQFTNDAAVNGNAYWDSAYFNASLAPGAYGHTVQGAADQEYHATFAANDFAGLNDTFSVAIVNWRLAGLTDARDPNEPQYAQLANLFNKFAGFGRGDVNNDNVVNLADIIYLADDINFAGKPGPIPFQHLGDVNADATTNIADVQYLIDYYFNYGPCPVGKWTF